HGAELGDLAHDAPLPRAIFGTVMGGRDRDVDVMPGGGAADLAAVLVGPGRGVGQRFPRLEEVLDDRPCPGREPRLDQSPGVREGGGSRRATITGGFDSPSDATQDSMK